MTFGRLSGGTAGASTTAQTYPPGWVAALGQNGDGQYVSSNNLLAGGNVQLDWIPMPVGSTLSKLFYQVGNAGVTLTAGQNFIGAYTVSGGIATLIGDCPDQTANFGAFGTYQANVTVHAGQSLVIPSSGGILRALLCNHTGTAVAIGALGTQQGTTNVQQSAGTFRACQTATGNTSLPLTITLSTTTSTRAYWGVAA